MNLLGITLEGLYRSFRREIIKNRMATFKGGDAKVVEFVRSQAEEILKKVPTNVHALSTIISCCEAVGDVDSLKHAAECCKKLITYDAIRKKYWEYKLQSIVEKI